jgi:hypothetical protein
MMQGFYMYNKSELLYIQMNDYVFGSLSINFASKCTLYALI